MKKLLLIALVAAGLTFAAVPRSNAGVSVGIGPIDPLVMLAPGLIGGSRLGLCWAGRLQGIGDAKIAHPQVSHHELVDLQPQPGDFLLALLLPAHGSTGR